MNFFTLYKWKEIAFLKCAYKMAVIVASHRKDVKMLACHKIIFQSVAQEECLIPIWKYVEGENGKITVKQE